MKVTQEQVNEFLLNAISGHPEFSQALETGLLAVRASPRSVTFKVVYKGVARQELARELRSLRARSGITQNDLAHHVGASPSAIIRMMHGDTLPTWATVFLTVTSLNGDVDHFRRLWDNAKEEANEHDD